MVDETLAWFALSRIPQVGPVVVRRLVQRAGSATAVFSATPETLAIIPQLPAHLYDALQQVDWEALKRELQLLRRVNIRPLTLDHTDYPPLLKGTSLAYAFLYMRGQARWLPQTPTVSIVGTRQPTPLQRRLAQQIAYELATAGWLVISGLALGIDSAAHEGALQTKMGTVAVLGCGLERLYPPENQALTQHIQQQGVLLSMVMPMQSVNRAQLMARNGLMAGMSTAVIVIASRKRGGALVTAKQAKKLGRPYFAVAGSAGTDLLLQQGARRWHSSEDFLAQVQSPQQPSLF